MRYHNINNNEYHISNRLLALIVLINLIIVIIFYFNDDGKDPQIVVPIGTTEPNVDKLPGLPAIPAVNLPGTFTSGGTNKNENGKESVEDENGETKKNENGKESVFTQDENSFTIKGSEDIKKIKKGDTIFIDGKPKVITSALDTNGNIEYNDGLSDDTLPSDYMIKKVDETFLEDNKVKVVPASNIEIEKTPIKDYYKNENNLPDENGKPVNENGKPKTQIESVEDIKKIKKGDTIFIDGKPKVITSALDTNGNIEYIDGKSALDTNGSSGSASSGNDGSALSDNDITLPNDTTIKTKADEKFLEDHKVEVIPSSNNIEIDKTPIKDYSQDCSLCEYNFAEFESVCQGIALTNNHICVICRNCLDGLKEINSQKPDIVSKSNPVSQSNSAITKKPNSGGSNELKSQIDSGKLSSKILDAVLDESIYEIEQKKKEKVKAERDEYDEFLKKSIEAANKINSQVILDKDGEPTDEQPPYIPYGNESPDEKKFLSKNSKTDEVKDDLKEYIDSVSNNLEALSIFAGGSMRWNLLLTFSSKLKR